MLRLCPLGLKHVKIWNFFLVPSLKILRVFEFPKQMESKGIWNILQKKLNNSEVLLGSFQKLLLWRVFSISQTCIQSINSDSVLEICTSLYVYKNRHKWWNRGELPRINEMSAKVQGKTHGNCQIRSPCQSIALNPWHNCWQDHSRIDCGKYVPYLFLKGLQQYPGHTWRHTHTLTGLCTVAGQPLTWCSVEMPGWAFPQKTSPFRSSQ